MNLPRLTLFGALVALGAAASGVSADVPVPPPQMDGAYLKLGFDRLSSYKFIAPDFDPTANPKATPPSGEEQIPGAVKGWSGKKAVVTGFMLPTKLDNGKAVEFLLMANQMACCYGTVPNMNEWIIVRSAQGVPIVQDVPISFRGTFTVSATYESGYMTGIYELQAEGPGQVTE